MPGLAAGPPPPSTLEASPFNGVRPANGAVHNPVYPFCEPGLHIGGVPLLAGGGAGGYPLSGSRSAASVLSAAPAAAPAPAPRRQPVRQPSQTSEELLREYGLDFGRLAVHEPRRDPAAPRPEPAAPSHPPPLPPKSARWTTFE